MTLVAFGGSAFPDPKKYDVRRGLTEPYNPLTRRTDHDEPQGETGEGPSDMPQPTDSTETRYPDLRSVRGYQFKVPKTRRQGLSMIAETVCRSIR